MTDTDPPRPLSDGPQPDADDLRSRIVAAAIDAFATRGFHATSTRMIAEAVGASTGALYVHFRSKEELLFEISLIGHRSALNVVKRAARTIDDPIQQLRAVVRAYMMDQAERRTTASVVNYELRSLTDEHRIQVAALRRELDFEVRFVLESGLRRGVFDIADPPVTATAILSLGIDLARWFRPGAGWSAERIADQYSDLVLRMVAVTPSATALPTD
ncbi:TetR/AcrR family transcriptional regulator [Dactylosporangium sp. CA-092794]|uniref:TetR/AcrR family transcriptional regulator n=1 Tax=Dactylosporangium sp. CA-092794 TaxID=3239929 RepID=UPI003D8DE3AC